jgi:hypothetical protein
MRFATVAVTALALLCAMPIAHAATDPASPVHSRGTTCAQPIPCPDGPAANWTPADLNASATQCLSTYLGYRSPDSFFEETGLDASGCLSNRTDVKSIGGTKVTLLPHCCSIKLPNNTCTFQCDLVNTQ